MKRAATIGLVASVALALAPAAGADNIDVGNPFEYFNLYSLGDIGGRDWHYASDVQGKVGAAGDVWFRSFSLLNMPGHSGWGLHAGGSANLSGTYLGGIDAGGDVAVGEVGISGSIHAGGNVTQFGGGAIGGDVVAAGSAGLDQTMTVYGQTRSGQAYAPAVDHADISRYFLETSAAIGDMTPTGSYSDEWGHFTLTGGEGVNVFSIDEGDLRYAWQVTIDAPEGSVVYINVPNEQVALDWTGWEYTGGITASDVIVNMSHALLLELSSTNAVNILAPRADTTFASGLVAGSLVVGDLQGGGQVNRGSFGHGEGIPEPATLGLLACGSAILLRRRKRRA